MTLPGVIMTATSIPVFTWPIGILGVVISTLVSVLVNLLVVRHGSVNNYYEFEKFFHYLIAAGLLDPI